MSDQCQVNGRNNRCFPEAEAGGLGLGGWARPGYWNGKEAAGLP